MTSSRRNPPSIVCRVCGHWEEMPFTDETRTHVRIDHLDDWEIDDGGATCSRCSADLDKAKALQRAIRAVFSGENDRMTVGQLRAKLEAE